MSTPTPRPALKATGVRRRDARTPETELTRLRANDLIAKWRKHASGCMKMARKHEHDGWAAEMASRAAEKQKSRREEKAKREQAREHASDRYRWFRVAETFRFCATELRRQVALTKKRRPESNKADMRAELEVRK